VHPNLLRTALWNWSLDYTKGVFEAEYGVKLVATLARHRLRLANNLTGEQREEAIQLLINDCAGFGTGRTHTYQIGHPRGYTQANHDQSSEGISAPKGG